MGSDYNEKIQNDRKEIKKYSWVFFIFLLSVSLLKKDTGKGTTKSTWCYDMGCF